MRAAVRRRDCSITTRCTVPVPCALPIFNMPVPSLWRRRMNAR